MTSPRFARGTKSRMLAYLSALLLFIAVLFLYHNARLEVSVVKEALAKCQQTQESLSAQLQEMNLKEETHRHQETKDRLMAHMSEEQERNKENKETHNKYTALQQQLKFVQTEFDDYKAENERSRATCEAKLKSAEDKAASELEKLKSKQSQVQEEADSNRKQLQDLQNEIKELNSAKERYKKENDDLKTENGRLKRQLESVEKGRKGANSSTDRGAVVGPDGGPGVAGAPSGALAAPIPGRPPSSSSSVATPDGHQRMNAVIADQLAASNSKALGKQSTTPQINPEALLSQEKAAHAAGVGGVLSPPVAPAPPSDLGPASPGSQQHPAVLAFKNHESQDVQQQQGAVLPVPLPFQQNQNQLQLPAVAAARSAPAVIPAQAPPAQAPPAQLHVVRESPSNQGQPPPLYDGSNLFQAPIPLQRSFSAQQPRAEWEIPLQHAAHIQRREPVAAPVEARGREERLRADWDRQQAPFQGVDYEREVHAGENEEDDDDDADPMDNAINAVRPEEKKFGANKFPERNVMVNPR